MEKGKVMSQDDLYNAIIRKNVGEEMVAGVGKVMNVDTNKVPKLDVHTLAYAKDVANDKSTIVVTDMEIILSGKRITIEGKATIHLDD